MQRRYTAAGVAAAIFEIDKAEDSETKTMLAVQNKVKEVMSNIEERISAVHFVDESKEPEMTDRR